MVTEMRVRVRARESDCMEVGGRMTEGEEIIPSRLCSVEP